MEEKHIAEIISIDGLEILAEPKEKATIQVGTLLKTTKINNLIFLVLDDLYINMIPGGSHESYDIPEEKLQEEYPHVNDYLRYLIKIYPLAEFDKEHYFPFTKSPVMNALLYEVKFEETKKIFDNIFVMLELARIDSNRFPKRNKAIIGLLKNYLSEFDKDERSERLKELILELSTAFRKDYASLMEIVRGVKG
ncbi:hypothetical protein [Caldisericum sp. AR60]|uniref:hypothetical protein n=1 Tax=Caldisericum sp. AR60 TaxID=3397852 RepID=UPI0039FB9FF0